MSKLYVICKIAESDYAIPATDVFQMESYSAITPVPGSPSYVAGLIQVRQQVAPVIDARLRFGLPAKQPDENSRFVILKLESRLVALLVDSAREVRNFADEEFKLPSEIIGGQTQGFVKSIAQIKDRIIMSIDGHKVVGEETPNGQI